MGSLPSPPPRENPADGSCIYVPFCGQGAPNWLESYNPSDNSWRHIGSVPDVPDNHYLKGFALVSLDDSVYVIGGRLCRKESEAEDEVSVRSEVHRYNVAAGEWSKCAPLLHPRFDFACAACDGKLYAAGGHTQLSWGRGTSAAEVYDPTRDRWDPLPNMRALRYKCVGVAWRGKFYAVGGFAVREGSTVVGGMVERSSAEVFDEERGEWELVPNMWQLDVPPNQIVSVQGQGLFSSGDCLNTWKGHIEAYDGKLNMWNIVEWSLHYDLSSLLITAVGDAGSYSPQMMQRLYLTMAPIGNRLYFLAGYHIPGEEFRSVSVVHVFDTLATNDEDAWVTSEPVVVEGDKELCAHCCAVSV